MVYDDEFFEGDVEDVDVPKSLNEKWRKEETMRALRVCPQCRKKIRKDSFECGYCGCRVFTDSGLIGRCAAFFASWGGMIVLCCIIGIIILYLI